MYPTIIISVITEAYGSIGPPYLVYFFKVLITIILTIPNLYGIDVIGKGMTMLGVLTLLPFVILSVMGFYHGDVSRLLEVRHESSTSTEWDIDWPLLINVLFWNLNGFEGISVFAGEVSNPKRTYPIALGVSVILVICSYLIPLCASAAYAQPSWESWNEGSFSDVALNVGGQFLAVLVILSYVLGSIGMFITVLFVDTFQLVGMAQLGLAPKCFEVRHAKYNTPRNAIYPNLVIMIGLSLFDFEDMLVMNNVITSMSIVLMLAASIKLRMSDPDRHRPFQGKIND